MHPTLNKTTMPSYLYMGEKKRYLLQGQGKKGRNLYLLYIYVCLNPHDVIFFPCVSLAVFAYHKYCKGSAL